MRKRLLILCLLLAGLVPARAQFFLVGDDPGRLRWYSLETAHYRVIYPEGADSLARVYGRSLEQFRIPMGRSLGGQTPGKGQRSKMPVVLHTHYTRSNGSVGWAPSRMDLYTHADSYGSDPAPWYIQLAAHEPRHQAQLQFGQRGILPWFAGQMWAPAYWQIYLEQAFGEGDAVVAETGLADGALRARTADFLNFYRVALDQGDYRSWDRWRYGSFKHYTPDHYALGYVTLAGARTLYDSPLLMREALDLGWKKPWYIAPFNTYKTISHHAGKPFKAAFKDILDSFNAQWQADAQARGPFMPLQPVTPDSAYDSEYSTPQWTEYGLFALRESYLRSTELVRVQGNQVQKVHSFASHTSSLFYDPARQRIYWSETLADPRWSLAGSSVIRYYSLADGKMHDLSRGTRYYNPQPDGDRVAVNELPVEGGSYVVVLDADSGAILRRVSLPQGVQGTEQAWLGEELYVSGLSLEGYGIYRLSPEGEWSCVLAPSRQKVVNMGSGDDFVEWVSDRSGVNELYRYFPESGKLLQMTNTRYGATDFTEGDGYLYSIVQTREGRPLFRTPLDALQPKEVNYADVCAYPVEDKLSEQERALGAAPNLDLEVPMSAPKRYRKLAHPLRLHSWLPAYVDYDAVKGGSLDFSYETASLGLSGYFQNTLGTFSGMIGYSLHPDPDVPAHWRNALHLQMTYTGLYPVFEAKMDVGDQASRNYLPYRLEDGDNVSYRLGGIRQDWPQFTASVRSYIPLRFSKSGILWGVTPQVKYSVSSNPFSTTPLQFKRPKSFKDVPAFYSLASSQVSLLGPLTQHLSASLRAYVMTSRASSQTYPRWGIGMEAGTGFRPGLTQYYAPNLYGYVYGYLPGFTRAQGFKWTATAQTKLGDCHIGDLYAAVLPRGFESQASTYVGQHFAWQWRVTADYAIPIYVGEISIPAVAYIKNFLLSPHADFTGLPGKEYLWSAGADLSASLARLFVLPFDASVGVSFSYLGGSLYENTGQEKPYSVSLIFGVDF